MELLIPDGRPEAKSKAYGTRYSQAVTHPSTNRALRCLTSVIGRELVCSTWYGRRQQAPLVPAIYIKIWARSRSLKWSKIRWPNRLHLLPAEYFHSWELQGRTAANWYKMPHCHNVSISSHTLCEKKNCAQIFIGSMELLIPDGRPEAKSKAYGTRYSQAVTHPSTNRALRCLTSQWSDENWCVQRGMVVDNRLLWCQLFISRFGQGQGRWNDPRSDGQTGCIYCLPSIFTLESCRGGLQPIDIKCHIVITSPFRATHCAKKKTVPKYLSDQWNY